MTKLQLSLHKKGFSYHYYLCSIHKKLLIDLHLEALKPSKLQLSRYS